MWTIILTCLLIELVGWFSASYIAARRGVLGIDWGDYYPPFSALSFLWPLLYIVIGVELVKDLFNYGLVSKVDRRIHDMLSKKEEESKDGQPEAR